MSESNCIAPRPPYQIELSVLSESLSRNSELVGLLESRLSNIMGNNYPAQSPAKEVSEDKPTLYSPAVVELRIMRVNLSSVNARLEEILSRVEI